MAEHDEKIFERDIEEMFRELDSSIKVPVIPNVQNVFDKAEQKKAKILPFGKYGKFFAAAAAVIVLIVAAPVIGGIYSGFLPMESEVKRDFGYMTADDINSAETETEVAEESENQEKPIAEEDYGVYNSTVEATTESTANEALRKFFSSAAIDNSKPQSGAVSNEKFETEDPKGITEEISESRFIDVTIEKEKVSVLLKDIVEDAEEELAVSSFWVEGTYEGSYLDGNYYFINMFKTVDEESLEDGSYLPKFGDEENEECIIPEESIFVSENIEEGIIRLIVEINIETGEYKIYASLV